MFGRRLLILFALVTVASAAAASTQPAYVIQHAKVVTVSGPILPDASVVIKGGLIAAVGRGVTAPPGATLIDGRGLAVYPGLFDPDCALGMGEAAPESQLGQFTPHLTPSTSFYADSATLPVAQAGGITHVLLRMTRGTTPSQGEIMNLAGRTGEDMLAKRRVALLLAFPTVGEVQYTEDERFQVTP